ncbi:MAG: PAS domain S-box protein [Verrucomicrobiota bacterium]
MIPGGRQLNVLLIEDDASDRMIACRALRESRLNPKVEEAIDIASGLAAIKKQPWDVVILDHILPDGKSLDALRELRDSGLRVPVVVTTAYGDETLAVELLKAGASDYVSKDRISADTLSRAISHAIRVHKAEEELRKQDLLLQGAAEAATLLHTHSDRLSVVNEALSALGRATAADRAVVFEHTAHPETREPAMSHRFEWAAGANDFKFNDPSLQNVAYRKLGLSRWHSALASGYSISGPVSTFPEAERKPLEARGIRSLILVPIFVSGRFWGFLKLEDCRAERVWSENEKSILSVTAAGIGSALVHRRADDALRQSEERYRAVVDEQAEPILRTLPDGTISFANDAFCRYVGRKREVVIGMNVSQVVPPDVRSEVLAHLQAVKRGAATSWFERRVPSSDGSARWMRWTDRLIRNSRGEITEIQSAAHDVTDLKKIEEALRQSEEKHRAFLDNLNVGVFRTSAAPPGHYLQANPAHARMLGYGSVDELMQVNVIDVYQNPADRFALLEALRTRGAVRDWELHFKKKDGTPIIVALTATAHLGKDGKIDWLEGAIEEVTERKKAEETLKESRDFLDRIINSIADPIFVKDRQHRLILVNDAECALAGHQREDILGRTDYDFFPKEQVDVFWAKDEEVFETGKENINEEVITDAAGVTRTIVTKKTLYTDRAGNKFIVGIIRDITERRRVEEERKQLASSLLEVQEQERKDISAMLHDHLGQLLTLTRLELGSVGARDPESEKSIKSAVQRLDEAIASVRRLAVSLRPPILDDLGPKEALESLTEEFADGSGIQVSFTCEGSLPTLGKDKETCLYRVLQEALTNAAKHSEAAQVEVLLRGDPEGARLEIRDNGKGFDTESQTPQPGLGFVGMRERLLRCGGSLEVQSGTGKGTTLVARVLIKPGPQQEAGS